MAQLCYIGSAALENFEALIKRHRPHSIFLVRGKKSFDDCGAKTLLYEIFNRYNIIVHEFMDFSLNPKYEDVVQGVKMFGKKKYDMLIAVGGGSVLDMGKLIRFFAAFSGTIEDADYKQTKDIVPLTAIPTTAGTGSEATHFSVIYKERTKYSVAHEHMLPDYAIVFPTFSYKLNVFQAASSAMDALSQAIESYWNINATHESISYATKALELIYFNIRRAVIERDHDSCNQIMEGAFWAGKAINITKTTAIHAMSYPFTSYFNIPHGKAVAILLPAVFELNYKSSPLKLTDRITLELFIKRKNDLFNLLHFADTNDAKHKLKQLVIDFKLSLSDEERKGIDKNIIINNINTSRAGNNPIKLDKQDIISVLNQI